MEQVKKHTYDNPVKILLWALVVLYVVMTLLGMLFSISVLIISGPLVVVVFALVHGERHYRWSGILTLLVFCLVVSNILENTSILTGFPFGHYYYTSAFGPKLFNVPLIIGPTYFSIGYLAWTLSTIIVGDVRRNSSAFQILAVPLIASFIMTSWDVALDPTASTIHQNWIWEQGGGYFGVPLTNFLGWYFTAFLFFILFAIFLRFSKTEHRETWTLPRSYYAQPIVIYAMLGLSFVLTYVLALVSGANTSVTDATGSVWKSLDIYETAAIISIYTLLAMAAIAAVKLLQGSTDAPKTARLEVAPDG